MTRSSRELDAFLHERIFGEEVVWNDGEPYAPPHYGFYQTVPHYSTDITAAMQLAEKLRQLECRVSIYLFPDDCTVVKFLEGVRTQVHLWWPDGSHRTQCEAGDTFPMAMARACEPVAEQMEKEKEHG